MACRLAYAREPSNASVVVSYVTAYVDMINLKNSSNRLITDTHLHCMPYYRPIDAFRFKHYLEIVDVGIFSALFFFFYHSTADSNQLKHNLRRFVIFGSFLAHNVFFLNKIFP